MKVKEHVRKADTEMFIFIFRVLIYVDHNTFMMVMKETSIMKLS